METTPGFASLDATLLMATLARETSKIGLLTTISTTFMPPYAVARQVLSLHHLSNGRAGWNIVTALDGNVNFGLDEMPTSDERYAKAAEFTEVVRALWEAFPAPPSSAIGTADAMPTQRAFIRSIMKVVFQGQRTTQHSFA